MHWFKHSTQKRNWQSVWEAVSFCRLWQIFNLLRSTNIFEIRRFFFVFPFEFFVLFIFYCFPFLFSFECLPSHSPNIWIRWVVEWSRSGNKKEGFKKLFFSQEDGKQFEWIADFLKVSYQHRGTEVYHTKNVDKYAATKFRNESLLRFGLAKGGHGLVDGKAYRDQACPTSFNWIGRFRIGFEQTGWKVFA